MLPLRKMAHMYFQGLVKKQAKNSVKWFSIGEVEFTLPPTLLIGCKEGPG
jgi:hypothetical protein